MIVFFLTWFSQQAPPCACERIPPSSSGWSRQQSSPGCRFRPSSARRMRSCLVPLWQAEAQLQELGRIGISNKVRICYSMLNQQFRMSYSKWAISEPPPPTALTLLFGIFILLATWFLGFVPTFHLNHRLHSFLGFLGLLKGPHGGGASFAAVLRLSWGQHLIYVSMGRTKTILFNEASIDVDKICFGPCNFIGPILIHIHDQSCKNYLLVVISHN